MASGADHKMTWLARETGEWGVFFAGLLRGGDANHGYDDLSMVRILGHMANMGYKATVNMSKQILDIQGKKHT